MKQSQTLKFALALVAGIAGTVLFGESAYLVSSLLFVVGLALSVSVLFNQEADSC
jgi:hypothetical protein